MGLIIVERIQDERGIHETNTYQLRFRGCNIDEWDAADGVDAIQDQGSAKSEPGAVQKSHQGSSKRQPPVEQKTNPQQTDSQETDLQETESQLPAPPEGIPLMRPPQEETGLTGAGGVADAVSRPSERASPPLRQEAVPGELSMPAPDEEEEACRQLVEFGVWTKPARQLVSSLKLTPEFVSRACTALRAESEQGKQFDNPSAVLFHRLMEGWVPPELEASCEEEDIPSLEDEEFPTALRCNRKSLPPVIDSRGREYDAYVWFNSLREEIRGSMPREIFDTWLRGADLADISCTSPLEDSKAPTLTIRLANRYAYEWVSQRLHKAIQRIADTMLGYHASIAYTAPDLEQTGHQVT